MSQAPDWTTWALTIATAFLAPSPVGILKGARPVQKTFQLIAALIAAAGVAVLVAEDAMGAGTGPEKRARVIATLRDELPALAEQFGVPAAFVQAIASDALLGFLVDSAVAAAHAVGALIKPEPKPAT